MDRSNKYSAILFSVASLAFFILITLYVFVYKPVSGNWEEKLLHMNDNWSLISSIWRLELLFAVLITWVALNFSSRNKWWNLVAIGHILMLVEYVLILGGYPVVTSAETYTLVNQLAVFTFAAANFIWLIGMAGVYQAETAWLKYTGMTLTLFAGIIFLGIAVGLTTMEQVVFVGPVINLLFLLNAYYGITLYRRTAFNKTGVA